MQCGKINEFIEQIYIGTDIVQMNFLLRVNLWWFALT